MRRFPFSSLLLFMAGECYLMSCGRAFLLVELDVRS